MFVRPTKQAKTLEIPENLLTPESCVSSTRIRQFLQISRHLSDDTIKPHLNEVSKSRCQLYFEDEIIPQWKLRSNIINYCKEYASTLKHDVQKVDSNTFDLRTNPYAYKDYERTQNEKNEMFNTLSSWINNEETVEKIIRDQTIEVFNDKCFYQDWFKLFQKISSKE